MRTKTVLSTMAVFIILPIAQLSMADDSAIDAMANIVISLNHFPSDADKERLSEIVESGDSSQAEIAVATAIANIEHKVKAADKESLDAIVADESATSQLRDLASVLLTMNHKLSASDIAKLEMNEPES